MTAQSTPIEKRCRRRWVGGPVVALALASTSSLAQVPTNLAVANSPAPPEISLTNTDPLAPTLSQDGIVTFNSAYPHHTQAIIEGGAAGGSTGDFGGFMAFHTKADDGSGALGEALVLTPGHHVTMPFGQYYVRFNTPASCPAGAACMFSTWTFASSYANTHGVPQQPNCPSLLVQDESVPGQVWVGGIYAISATSVTYSFAPLLTVSTPHTIDVYATCYALGF